MHGKRQSDHYIQIYLSMIYVHRETPTGSQIRDTNRPALIGAFRDDNYAVIDLGIVCDSKELLRAKLLEATADLKCISYTASSPFKLICVRPFYLSIKCYLISLR